MKYLDIYKEKINCKNDEDVFQFILSNLKETIRKLDFFVDWRKVFNNINDIAPKLILLNNLFGKDNVKDEFKNIILNYPEVIEVMPILLAIREKQIKALDINSIDNKFNYIVYNFKRCQKLSNDGVEKVVEFADKSGIFNLFINNKISNLIDYVIGIEVGLDSNARKNRIGRIMEDIVEKFIKEICLKYNYRYIKQAKANNIKRFLGYDIIVDEADRKFDFAIDNGKKLFLIEANYFSGGGSKLKSVSGEFISLFNFIKSKTPEHEFIWITDGLGWRDSHRPLREAFDKIDYVLNICMLENGILEEILK
jgi:type II restriction enzyme